MRIKLMPPFMIGRYFQALAIYLSDSLEVLEYGPDYVEVEDESYWEAIDELVEKVKAHLDHTRTQLPLYGNDHKYFFKKVLGAEEAKRLTDKDKELGKALAKARGEKAKEIWTQRVKIWKEMWEKTIRNLPNLKTSLAHLQILKASVHKYPKDFVSTGKDSEVKTVEDPRGEALAVAGALLSILGNVSNLVLTLLPPLPESMREDENFLDSLRARYEALEGLSLAYPFDKVPCSSEVLLQFIFAREFKEKISEKIDCLNPVDNMFVAGVVRGGNRPMINSIMPIMASEITCKLGKGEVIESLLKQLYRDPDVAGACVNDLFQYVLSGNPEHVYRCARRYSDELFAQEDVRKATAKKMVRELAKVIA